tara:strand:- start:5819 stop:6157 length:339 start_codon:yes stop_codon:yes gene_type:complete
MKKIFDNPNLIIVLLTIFAFILIISSCSKEELKGPPYWTYIQQGGHITGDWHYDYMFSAYYDEDTFHNNYWNADGSASSLNLPPAEIIIYSNTKYNLSTYVMPSPQDSIVIK